MAKVTAKLEGLRGLKRTIRRYPKKVKKELQFELKAQTEDLQGLTRKEINRQDLVQSGNLLSSIAVDFSELDKLYALVYSALEYARRQEFGFTGTDSLGRSYDQPGHHYFQKALNEKKKTFSQDMAKAVRRARP